jgi:hypothetical protein
VTYSRSTHSKNEIYLEVLPLFTSGAIELLDIPQLRTQLLLLERRPRSGGRDTVDHPRGAHDDLCNAACGALRLASKLSWTGRNAEYSGRGQHLRSADVDPYPDPQEVPDQRPRQTIGPIRDGWGRIVRGA